MSGVRRKIIAGGIVLVAMALGLAVAARTTGAGGAREKLIGAWRLVRIDGPGSDGKPASGPQPTGMLIYTQDGHMSVQIMYPPSSSSLSNDYVLKGYEASFGGYDVDETAHTVTHHVQGSITRGLLAGKDLPRKFEFTPDGRLIIRSARPDEHWFVTWAHL